MTKAVLKSFYMSNKWLLMMRYSGMSRFLAAGSSMKDAMMMKTTAATMKERASPLPLSPVIELSLRLK